MNRDTLNKLLDVSNREKFYEYILDFFESLNSVGRITCELHEISEGKIPIINIGEKNDISKVNSVKLFIGAQHNEFNGLFGIIEFLQQVKDQEILLNEICIDNQLLIFAPLMNPHGFLNPREDNKSGYYIKNGSNLNRFWRRVFTPEYEGGESDLIMYPIPEHNKVIQKVIEPFWNNEDISIYIIDFHETSLLERFPKELSMNLTNHYKFDHWLKERIIINILEFYEIKYYRKPLFYKCNLGADHNHINLTGKQIDLVREKLFEFLSKNHRRLPFYFCYSKKSKEYCSRLGEIVYEKLKDILWETKISAFDHEFHDHGCLVKMNEGTSRNNIFCIELEGLKQFFSIFEELDKSKTDASYFENKLKIIDKSLRLVKETIIEMIKLF